MPVVDNHNVRDEMRYIASFFPARIARVYRAASGSGDAIAATTAIAASREFERRAWVRVATNEIEALELMQTAREFLVQCRH